jgi:hypothetical protein
VNIVNKLHISNACAPVAGTTQSSQRDRRIFSPTQLGSGTVGPDSRILSCVFDRLTDEHGNFRADTPYAVMGEIQAYSAVSTLLRPVEWKPAVTIDQKTGLLYRKLPSPNGFSNSWLTSGETAVQSWVNTWGRVTSDRNAGVYRFEALNLPGRSQPDFPDIDELIDELLAEFVIDSLDHPVLERLLNPAAPPTATTASAVYQWQDNEGDADEIY